jgi:hypothetical protein
MVVKQILGVIFDKELEGPKFYYEGWIFFYADFSTKNGAKFITDKAAEHSKS